MQISKLYTLCADSSHIESIESTESLKADILAYFATKSKTCTRYTKKNNNNRIQN